MIAGIWSEWTSPETGEVVPNYAMLTFNVNDHPMLNRLHRPERGRATGEELPLVQQDKRGEAHIEPEDWMRWLQGDADDATTLLHAPSAESFDQADAVKTDPLLALGPAESQTP